MQKPPRKITVPVFRDLASKGQKLTMLTAYDYLWAGILDDAGIDSILVGDSLAMVVQGRFWWLPVVLITVREGLISAFRSYWGRRGLAVQASQLAKFKTFLQFGAVGWVVFPLTTDIRWLGDSFLWAGVAVAWISAAQYVAAGSKATSSMLRE